MALTILERALLLQARDHLESRRSDTLCSALERAVEVQCRRISLAATAMPVAAARRLQRYIDTVLGDHVMLLTWQHANGFGDRGDEQRRADRLAWIDWMLEEPA
jgi:hypothetical protein